MNGEQPRRRTMAHHWLIAITLAWLCVVEARPRPQGGGYGGYGPPPLHQQTWADPGAIKPKSKNEWERQLQEDDEDGYAARLRKVLLQGYDRGAFPWEHAWAKGGWNATTGKDVLRSGLEVEIGINFHRVFEVDIKSSVVDLIIWFRQRWQDPRLAWDPEDYGGLQTTWFWIGDGVGSGETSEIWTPDIKLWNMETSLSDSLVDSYATVDSSGTVFWSRPGHLRPVCKFEGLDRFPFDALSCTMEFGSWSYSGLYLRPIKMGEGYTLGGSETAGEAFAEYSLPDKEGSLACREHVYPPYPSLPEEDWPVLFYDVTFHRSWQPYVRGYVLMQVILNLAGFASFWVPPQAGERVALAITALLAAVASELVVAANLPTASEMTWFQSFSLFSLAYAAFALFESVAVVYFFYYTGSDLVPKWARWIQQQTIRFWNWLRKPKTKEDIPLYPRRRTSETWAENGNTSDSPSDEAGSSDESNENKDAQQDEAEMDNASEASTERRGNDSVVRFDESITTVDDMQNVSTASLTVEDLQQTKKRPSLLRPSMYDASFRAPAAWSMQNIPAGRDADDFQDSEAAKNNLRWQRVAREIDTWCRLLGLLSYGIVLTILLRQVEYL